MCPWISDSNLTLAYYANSKHDFCGYDICNFSLMKSLQQRHGNLKHALSDDQVRIAASENRSFVPSKVQSTEHWKFVLFNCGHWQFHHIRSNKQARGGCILVCAMLQQDDFPLGTSSIATGLMRVSFGDRYLVFTWSRFW